MMNDKFVNYENLMPQNLVSHSIKNKVLEVTRLGSNSGQYLVHLAKSCSPINSNANINT